MNSLEGRCSSSMASVSMVIVQKGSRGLTGTQPLLPSQWGDPERKVDDYKDFLMAIAAERTGVQLEHQKNIKNVSRLSVFR